MGGEILLVHQDQRLRQNARQVLEQAGHVVDEANRLTSAWSRIEESAPALILLAWAGEDAVKAALRRIKAEEGTRASRIIVIAPKAHFRKAIAALEYGAEDCFAVPFAAEELLSRVNACLRRPPNAEHPDQIKAGRILLDRGAHRFFVNGACVDLAPTEFRLLAFFLEHQGRMFSRGELLERAWPNNIKAGERTVDVHVRRLRQALEPHRCDHMIQTVRGFGYRFSDGPPNGNEHRPSVRMHA